MQRFLFGLILMGLVASVGAGGAAEPGVKGSDYPNRAITIIVPWAPGGPSDTVSRIIAGHMSRLLGQKVLVENIMGAGGTTASLRAKQAAPDGYTLLVGNMGTHAAAVALYPKLGYDPRTDFEPIGILLSAPIVILARKDFPAKDWKEFVSYLQANAHKLDEGHGGVGSIPFTACLLLNHMLAVKPRLVPHDGAAPSIEALARGRIDYMCDQTVSAAPHVRAGRVKAYAIAAPERSLSLPEVPTTSEVGFPKYQLSAWQAMFVPKGVPNVVAEKLNEAVFMALDDQMVRSRLVDLGSNIPDREQRTRRALADLVSKEVDRWAAIIKASAY